MNPLEFIADQEAVNRLLADLPSIIPARRIDGWQVALKLAHEIKNELCILKSVDQLPTAVDQWAAVDAATAAIEQACGMVMDAASVRGCRPAKASLAGMVGR